MKKLSKLIAAIAIVAIGSIGNAAAGSDRAVKIGVMNDQSGPYADGTGKGSVVMAQLAIEDFGQSLFGKPIELISADHLNKPDVGAGIASRWLDLDHVDAIFDVPNSAVLLAVQEVVRNKSGLLFASGGSTTAFTGKACSPFGFQWTFDTFSLANGAGRALSRQGLKTWFLVQADYAFGEAAASDLEKVLSATGGEIVGRVKTPLNTSDFSSFLLQAQASKAQVIALLNAGADTVNSLKQANEFQIPQHGQYVFSLIFFESDARAVGLKDAQGLTVTLPFYWHQSPETEAISKRYFAKMGRMPNYVQIGVYSSVLHYLKAVQAAGTHDRAAIAAKVHELPVNDAFVKNGAVRDDGRMLHDMLLGQVKSPKEVSAADDWDVFKIIATIPAAEATRPLPRGECPFVK